MEEYMKMAIELAQQGIGAVNPNPLVGAVIVKDGIVIGKGYHEQYGQLHAERNAFKNCTADPKGATMYVTLEPCCHTGKTPPCTEAIIENQIAKVYVSCLDPNPLVAGKGIALLEEAGIAVEVGLLEEVCRKQNEVFFHYIQTKKPFVVMKYAMTMDGKIATTTGKSKWITGELAREQVQKQRHQYTGIMVGIGTILADNPMLNCRMEGGRNPVRIICDTQLKTPLESNIVQTAKEIRTILATNISDKAKHTAYEELGCEILEIPQKEKHIDLEILMMKLGEQKIDSILLEGGGILNFSALQSKIVQKVYAYVAPKLFGGETSRTPVCGAGFLEVADCVRLKTRDISVIGEDILIESDVEYKCLQEL